MTRHTVTAGGRQYTVVPDRPGTDRVFVIGSVVDDADGRAIARQVTVTSDESLVFSARSEHEVGLAGNPQVAFVDRSVSHTVDVVLGATGYRAATRSITIPAFAPLPHRHDFTLRRLPLVIRGRVYGRTAGPPPTFEPLPGASVALSPVPASGGELPLLLRQPLRADPGPGATIRRRSTAAQAPLVAIADTAAGNLFVEVADGTGVASGQLLRVGPAHRRFHAQVEKVITHPDRPPPAALIELTETLAGAVPTDTSIDRFTLGAFSGNTGNFVGDAFAGESIVWIDALPGSGGVTVIREAGQPDRYHDVNALSDPSGDYLIEGIARIGEPTFDVSAGGFTTKSGTFRLARLETGPLDWYLVP